MKKILVLSLSVLALVANLTSCKKGENDPMLSLHTRKARVVGVWTLTKSESTDVNTNSSGTTTNTYSYDGTTETGTQTSTNNGGTSVTTPTIPQIYTLTIEFKKDRTYLETYSLPDGSKYTANGDWNFVGKNKSLKLKNKEAICLLEKSNSNSSNGTTQTTNYTGLSGSILVIDQLKNKEMIIIDESTSTSNGSTSSYSSKMTLTNK